MSLKDTVQSSMDVVVLCSSGHLGSAMIMNKLLNMPEINIVGVVKSQPLKLTFRGRSRIKQHLKKVGWKILKKNIISLPHRGVLNIHPGWLPAYKGAMAYFWV